MVESLALSYVAPIMTAVSLLMSFIGDADVVTKSVLTVILLLSTFLSIDVVKRNFKGLHLYFMFVLILIAYLRVIFLMSFFTIFIVTVIVLLFGLVYVLFKKSHFHELFFPDLVSVTNFPTTTNVDLNKEISVQIKNDSYGIDSQVRVVFSDAYELTNTSLNSLSESDKHIQFQLLPKKKNVLSFQITKKGMHLIQIKTSNNKLIKRIKYIAD